MSLVKINVLMPAFNEAPFIEEAIASVLNFDYPEGISVTIFVVDDFSTDDTVAVVHSLRGRYGEKLVFLKNKKKGKNSAFNTAFKLAESGYVCILGGDDRIVPEVLIERAMALERAGESRRESISACKIKTFSEDERYRNILLPRNAKMGSLSGGAVMFSVELGKLIFPLPESLPNEDSWIGLHIRYRGVNVIHVPKVGLDYRIHSGNSHKRGEEFGKYNLSMWKRGRAALLFYVQYQEILDDDLEKKLAREVLMECAKYLRASFSILFFPKSKINEKIRALTYSSKAIYFLKQKFYRFLAGH